jgi:hypothetical protein
MPIPIGVSVLKRHTTYYGRATIRQTYTRRPPQLIAGRARELTTASTAWHTAPAERSAASKDPFEKVVSLALRSLTFSSDSPCSWPSATHACTTHDQSPPSHGKRTHTGDKHGPHGVSNNNE